jgi:hypothetical protein
VRHEIVEVVADGVAVERLRVGDGGERAAECDGEGAAAELGGDREHFGARIIEFQVDDEDRAGRREIRAHAGLDEDQRENPEEPLENVRVF